MPKLTLIGITEYLKTLDPDLILTLEDHYLQQDIMRWRVELGDIAISYVPGADYMVTKIPDDNQTQLYITWVQLTDILEVL
jgi:hypothetical protein